MVAACAPAKSLLPPAEEIRFPSTADGCAGLLLETIPLLMRAVQGLIHDAGPSDLTVPQFRTLLFVHRHDGTSLSDAAEFLGLTLPSTSKLVDQLVKRRFLEREHDSVDRRRMVLRLTVHGNALLKDAHSIVRARLADILNDLNPSETTTLHRTLALLQQAFPLVPLHCPSKP